MIKAVIFDLDNTLLDFIKMKREAVMNALLSMKEAGLEINIEDSYKKVMSIYETEGWDCLLYTSPSPRDRSLSRMPSSA